MKSTPRIYQSELSRLAGLIGLVLVGCGVGQTDQASTQREMLSSITAAPLLDGVRGAQGADQEGIVDLIGRLSQLVTELPAIRELDLNPIIAYADRVCVVDARVRL